MPGTRHLFTVTRLLLRIATGFCFFLIAVLALALVALEAGALGIFHLPIPANEMAGLTMSAILGIGAVVVTAGMICIGLAAWIFILTARIVDTADHGDPFVARNAARLNHIGLLLLAIQVIGFATETAMDMMPEKLREHVSSGFDVSPAGILAALLIFVLAQIFRRGSEMRAELEGTV
jgi:hypothetical protein